MLKNDWRKLVASDDIDAIDICTPNNLHADIAIEAAKHGKAILCEKPLSMDTPEGEKMCEAVEKAGVPNTVWYNYRRMPAVTYAKQLIDEGRFGSSLSLSSRVSSGLDNKCRATSRWCCIVAARFKSSWQWRHG